MNLEAFCSLLGALIRTPRVQSLWAISDRGMPVFAHSMDVALICLERYPSVRERFPGFRLDVVLLGAVLHDLTKLSARSGHSLSHSRIMTDEPSIAAGEAMSALDEAQLAAGVRLDDEGIDHVWHVVAAHHGPWGKVKPGTPEAELLFHCDNFSAMYHRTAPIDANDVLPLLARGYRWAQVGELLGVGRSIVKARLQDACRAENVRDSSELLARWREQRSVIAGAPDQVERITRARFAVSFARCCPEALLERVRPVLRSSQAAD